MKQISTKGLESGKKARSMCLALRFLGLKDP